MLSKLIKKRKMEIFQTKRRSDYIRGLIDRHEKMTRAHHLRHYGVEKLKWEWGTIDHLGVWAFGGDNKEKSPVLKDIGVQVPKSSDEKIYGWYCYVGPIPEFE